MALESNISLYVRYDTLIFFSLSGRIFENFLLLESFELKQPNQPLVFVKAAMDEKRKIINHITELLYIMVYILFKDPEKSTFFSSFWRWICAFSAGLWSVWCISFGLY